MKKIPLQQRLAIAKPQIENACNSNNIELVKKCLMRYYNLYLDCQNTQYVNLAEYLKLKMMLVITAYKAGIIK